MTFDERTEKMAKGKVLVKPDYSSCIAIATQASLTVMIAPAALVILSPILVGAIFGCEAVVGLLVDAMSSSVQLAISMSNTGGTWDNSKKYCEKGGLNGWFMYRDGKGGDEDDFKAKAKTCNGNDCLVIPGQGFGGQMVMGSAMGVEGQQSFEDWLGELAKTDEARYKKIMNGEEGVRTTDGRLCVYAGKKSKVHAACVIGDTVGDPFKDTSGPALNIVMKLMAIISVVFADFFMSINHGNGAAFSGDMKWIA